MADGVPTTPLTQWLEAWLKPPAGVPQGGYDEQLEQASRVWQGQAPTGKLYQESLLPEGTTPAAVEQQQRRDQQAPVTQSIQAQPATTQEAFGDMEGDTPPASVGANLNVAPSVAMQTVPSGAVGQNDAIKAALLQLGLGLLTPRYGGIGRSLGEAAGAYVRAIKGGKAEGLEEQLGAQKTRAEIQALQALTNMRNESARAKRAKGSTASGTEFERFAKALELGPKGSLFLKEQLESFGEDIFADDSVPLDQQFNEIVEKAKLLDTGGGTGGAGSSEGVNPNTGKAFDIGDEFELEDGSIVVLKAFPASDEKNWVAKE